MLKSNKLKLTKKKKKKKGQEGFLPLLLGALGSLVLGSLFGNGLQADTQQRPYSRVPRGKGLQVDSQQRRVKKKKKKKKEKKGSKNK